MTSAETARRLVVDSRGDIWEHTDKNLWRPLEFPHDDWLPLYELRSRGPLHVLRAAEELS